MTTVYTVHEPDGATREITDTERAARLSRMGLRVTGAVR